MNVLRQNEADSIARADAPIHQKPGHAVGAIIELRVCERGAVRVDCGLAFRKAARAGFEVIA
jgi:hypothetical protein